MGNLITITDFEGIRDISTNIPEERINPFIAESQEFDIKPALGPALYLAFVNGLEASPQVQIYVDLFEGKTYTDTALNAEISFLGLKKALIYYSYARLILNQDFNVTSFGNVFKNNENYSQSAEEKRVMRAVTAAKEAGNAIMNDAIKFLNDNYTDYPLWLKHCNLNTTVKGGINISRVTKYQTRVWCGRCRRNSRNCNCINN